MANASQVVVQSGPIWASRDELTLRVSGPSPSGGAPTTFDFARTAAQITAALYDLVEQEGMSTEHVSFRVRSLNAEQSGYGAFWLGGARGEPNQAAIEVNLALYDNALRVRLLGRIAEVSGAIISAAGGTLRIEVDYALPALVNDDHVTGALDQAGGVGPSVAPSVPLRPGRGHAGHRLCRLRCSLTTCRELVG